jgi:hypothetical protein
VNETHLEGYLDEESEEERKFTDADDDEELDEDAFHRIIENGRQCRARALVRTQVKHEKV